MENHGNDVVGRVGIIFTEVSRFIDEYAEFVQGIASLFNFKIKIAGNLPALDGPGSFDQSQSMQCIDLLK
jgi:hypothetical protein